MAPKDLDDVADEGEDAANDLANLLEIYLEGAERIECQHKLDKIMTLFGTAIAWHSGLHFEPDFDVNSIEH